MELKDHLHHDEIKFVQNQWKNELFIEGKTTDANKDWDPGEIIESVTRSKILLSVYSTNITKL